MMTPLPKIDIGAWKAAAGARSVFAALSVGGAEARIIGGAVRNALMGRPIADIDFATTAAPETVLRLAAAARIKVVPTGIDHGTLTLVVHGQPFEVTTLREDISTDGRRAAVRFGSDWEADARRRDFTVNALSVDADGMVHDPLGGYDDIVARRIRFIGAAEQRIAEDRLRILRFFRFNAEYGRGAVDAAGLAATTRARNELRELSAERVGQEMRRLITAPRAAEMLGVMQEAGILTIVLGGIGTVATLARLAAFEEASGMAPDPTLRLAALACRIEEDVLRIGVHLRLANAERDRMLAALAAARAVTPPPDERGARLALYRHGAAAYADGVALAAAWSGAESDVRWGQLMALPKRWPAPRFPLTGRDIIGHGVEAGPAVGALLRAVEDWWIERDFAPDEAELRRRLQQAMAQQQ